MKPYIHKVQYYETDRMQVTHHSNYIRFMEEARVAYLTAIGWDYRRMEQAGILSPVVEVSCRYLKTTTFEDSISIEVAVEDISAVKLKLSYRMESGGETVFRAVSTHCFLNGQGKPIHLKKELPGFYDALAKLKKQEEAPDKEKESQGDADR
jgi:acyl-CoA thioester hydrolase